MRWLMVVLVAAVFLSCGDGDRSAPAGPAGKVSADCTLAEIFSGKEGCQADPSLDVVPEGYVAPVDSTETAVTDTTETVDAASDSTGTGTGTGTETPSDTSEPESETPSGGTGAESETPSGTAGSGSDPELVVPEPVIIHVPGEEEPETALHEAATLTAEQARAQLDSLGIAYTGAAFRLAAQSGNLEVVQLFVQAGMSLEEADDDLGWTALYEAAYAGRLGTVKYLVGQGANIEARDEDGYTVLMNAAGITNNLSVVRFLVESGADVLAVGDDQRTTAWSVAMTVGNTAIADYLKSLTNAGDSVPLSREDARAELRRLGIDYSENTFFRAAAGDVLNAYGQGVSGAYGYVGGASNLDVVKLFVWAGWSADYRGSNYGETALHNAAAGGHLAAVRYLVEQGADLEATRYDDYTPLHDAAAVGHLAVVRYLVEQGADLEAKGRYDLTALLSAAYRGHWEVVKFLVGAGADLEAAYSRDLRSRNGFTALLFAVEGGRLDMVKVLVGAGADVNVRARAWPYYPALHYAAVGGRLDMVKVLVGAGADVKATILGDNTARDVARSSGHTAVVEYFDSLPASDE